MDLARELSGRVNRMVAEPSVGNVAKLILVIVLVLGANLAPSVAGLLSRDHSPVLETR